MFRFWSVANFGTFYSLLKIKIIAKRKREFTTKFALESSLKTRRIDEVTAIKECYEMFKWVSTYN